jgi:hypothetical protein
MQFLDGKLLFSASDLVNFLGCKHATYLDLRNLADEVAIPERDAATVLIFEKGLEHEKRYLAALKARGLPVVEIIWNSAALSADIVCSKCHIGEEPLCQT